MEIKNLSRRQLATIVAALGYWKREGLRADVCAEALVASDYGTITPLSATEIDSLCKQINPPKLQTHKVFKVSALSSNRNSFGLRQMILIAQDGEAWKVHSNDINFRTGGEVLRVEMNRETGEPMFGRLGFEIPEQIKPGAPPEVVKEVWAT